MRHPTGGPRKRHRVDGSRHSAGRRTPIPQISRQISIAIEAIADRRPSRSVTCSRHRDSLQSSRIHLMVNPVAFAANGSPANRLKSYSATEDDVCKGSEITQPWVAGDSHERDLSRRDRTLPRTNFKGQR